MHENLLVGVGIAARSRARARRGDRARKRAAQVEQLIERFNLAGYRTQAAGLLPEGVRKLLDIAMAVAGGPRVLLLDEPTSGVSADEKFRLMDMVMGALQAQGVTVLFVEHDMDIVSRYTHRILAFYEGRIIADGDPQAVLKDAEVRRYVIGEQIHVAAQGGSRCCGIEGLDVSIGPVEHPAQRQHGAADGKVHRADRPQRRRQDHADALHHGHPHAAQRLDPLRRRHARHAAHAPCARAPASATCPRTGGWCPT